MHIVHNQQFLLKHFFYSQHQLELQPPRTQFSDDSDELVLEDELQRIILQGKIDVHTVVTGMIIIHTYIQ